MWDQPSTLCGSDWNGGRLDCSWPYNLNLDVMDDVEDLLDWVATPKIQEQVAPDALCPFAAQSAPAVPPLGGPTSTTAGLPGPGTTALGLQWDSSAMERSCAAADQLSTHQTSTCSWSLPGPTLHAATVPTTGVTAVPSLTYQSQLSTAQAAFTPAVTAAVLGAAGFGPVMHQHAMPAKAGGGAVGAFGRLPAACMALSPFSACAGQPPAHAASCCPAMEPAGQLMTCCSNFNDRQQRLSTGTYSCIPGSMGCAGMRTGSSTGTTGAQSCSPVGMGLAGCAGMDAAAPSTPAGWTALPSSSMQADAHGMHGNPSTHACCPLGLACAGVYCIACLGSTTATAGGTAGSTPACILPAEQCDMSPAGSGSSTSTFATTDAAAAVLAAAAPSGSFGAGTRYSPVRLTGHAMASMRRHGGTGVFETINGGAGVTADTAQPLLAVSQAAAAAAAAHEMNAVHAMSGSQTAMHAPCASQDVTAAAATAPLPGTNSPGNLSERPKPPAQKQAPAPRLGKTLPGKKVIAKSPRRTQSKGMQVEAQAPTCPVDESRVRMIASNNARLQAALQSLQACKAQLKERLDMLRAEVNSMTYSNSQLRAANSELQAQVQAVTLQAQQRALLPAVLPGAQPLSVV